MDKLKESTFISKDVSFFKQFTETLTDEFLSFDHSIKWMEIINYMFALIGISRNNLMISEEIQQSIKNAYFKTWRDFTDSRFHTDKSLQIIMTSEQNNRTAFDEFQKLWFNVTSRQYIFRNYTVQEMLDATCELRNYTRGHGVFTFEISQEMNIGLTKVLVFLINQLIDYLSTAGNLDNLLKMGWVIFIRDVPYYLYSVDATFEELKYESFQIGNSIAIPLGTRR